MEERNVNTWEEFKKELDEVRREHESSGTPALLPLYRGQENSCWSLSTTLDRKRERMPFRDYYRIIDRIRPQVESLTGQEWPIPEYPKIEELSRKYEFFDELGCGRCPGYPYMTYLRHQGFPSPLLDWTRSPYVASFFAFNKAAEDSQERVSIFMFAGVPRNKMHGSEMPIVLPYGQYVRTHRRHFLQQSKYTLCLRFREEWRFGQYRTVFNEGRHQQGICWKFTIPVTERRKVLKELDEYNLNALSLFGSEESMMETFATREFLFANSITEKVLSKSA